jgi:hypothetical protein
MKQKTHPANGTGSGRSAEAPKFSLYLDQDSGESAIGAIGPDQAARIAQSMYPGSRVMRILKVSGP